MTKIDFYILPQADVQQRQLFACRLAEKAYKLGHQIYIHSGTLAQAEALDRLLWEFRDSSFLPHELVHDTSSGDPELAAPVQIGYSPHIHPSISDCGLLINLTNSVPEFFSRFDRVSEIVVQDPQIQRATRESYRFYRDRGYRLDSHDLRQ